MILESSQSRRTDHFSNIVADREFSTGCYWFTVFNSRLLSVHRPARQWHYFSHRHIPELISSVHSSSDLCGRLTFVGNPLTDLRSSLVAKYFNTRKTSHTEGHVLLEITINCRNTPELKFHCLLYNLCLFIRFCLPLCSVDRYSLKAWSHSGLQFGVVQRMVFISLWRCERVLTSSASIFCASNCHNFVLPLVIQ